MRDNIFTATFYVLYLGYFVFTALQLQYGMPLMRKGELIYTKTGFLWNVLYAIYHAVPLVHEMRVLMDWALTPTAMSYWEWLKFEAIYR